MRYSVFLAFLLVTPLCFADNKGEVLSSAGGRYVFGQVSEFRQDQYLLDTQTGRMWSMTVDERTHQRFLSPFLVGRGQEDFSFSPDGPTFRASEKTDDWTADPPPSGEKSR